MRRRVVNNGEKELVDYTLNINWRYAYLAGFTRLERGIAIKGETIVTFPFIYGGMYYNTSFTSPKLKVSDISINDLSSWQYFNTSIVESSIRNHQYGVAYDFSCGEKRLYTYQPSQEISINGNRIDIDMTYEEIDRQVLSCNLSSINLSPSPQDYGPFNSCEARPNCFTSCVITSGNTFRAVFKQYQDTTAIALGLNFSDGNKSNYKLHHNP